MVLTGTGFTIPVEILSYELSEVMAVLPGSVPDDGPFSRRPGRKAACITCNGRNASTIYGLSPEQEEPVVDLWPATSELLVTERSSTSDVGLWNFWLWKPVSLKSQNRNEYMVGGRLVSCHTCVARKIPSNQRFHYFPRLVGGLPREGMIDE